MSLNSALSLTLSLMLLCPSAMAAGPLCARVLMPASTANITQADIDQTLASIARFGLEVDLLKAAQTNSSWKFQENLFKKKYRDLVSSLSGIYSEKEIKTRISQEISLLQGKNKSSKIKKEAARAAQEQTDDVYTTPYVLTKSIPLKTELLRGNHFGHQDAMEFVPKLNSLLLATEAPNSGHNTSIVLLDLNTLNQSVLWQTTEVQTIKTKFASSRKFFTALGSGKDQTGELFFYDIDHATAKVLKIPDNVGFKPKDEVIALDITPSGDSILLITNDSQGAGLKTAFLIDTQTGIATYQAELTQTVRKTWNDWDTQFLSENELLIRHNYTLGLFNLSTKHGTEDLFYGEFFQKMLISPELDQIFLVPAYNPNNQNPTLQTASKQPRNGEMKFVLEDGGIDSDFHKMKSLPAGGIFYRQKLQAPQNKLLVTKPGGRIQPSLILEDPTDVKPADMTVDLVGRRLFIYSVPDDLGVPVLQVWQNGIH